MPRSLNAHLASSVAHPSTESLEPEQLAGTSLSTDQVKFGALAQGVSRRGSAFLGGKEEDCLQQERPCPEVNITRAAWYNARKGPKNKAGIEAHVECCHAIKRSRRAWAKTDRLIDKNVYLKYCSFGVPPFEPLAEALLRWWRGSKPEADEDSDKDELKDASAEVRTQIDQGSPLMDACFI